MRINNINSTSFNGMWAPVQVSKQETGVYHLNKKLFTLYDMVYHPWIDETKEAIQKEVDKYFWGRTFSVMDIGFEDMHYKCDIYSMNRVKVGNKIKHEDKEQLIKQGYGENVNVCTPGDKEFKASYNDNASYAVRDVYKLDAERINELVDEYFQED